MTICSEGGLAPPSEPAGLLSQPVEPVAGVAEAGHDVALLVETLVHRGGDQVDRYVDVSQVLLDPRRTLGGRQQADRDDVVGATVDEEADGSGERPPVASIGSRTSHWRPDRSSGSLSAYVIASSVSSLRAMPEEADLRGREQPRHALEHAEPGAQDRYDERRRRERRSASACATGVCTVTGSTRTSRVAS